MDRETQVSVEEPEQIRRQMQDTRAALAEKIESLEEHVVQTVQGTTSAVTDTVETVKEAVQETVGSVKESVQDTMGTVKETLDVSRQVERHPWVMFGGSVAAGYVAARIFLPGPVSEAAATNGNHAMPVAAKVETAPSRFGPEMDRLRALALGAAMGLVRDLVADALPQPMRPSVAEVMNSITAKLGGEPVRGRLVPRADRWSSGTFAQPF